MTGTEAAAYLRAQALAVEGAEYVELDCRVRVCGSGGLSVPAELPSAPPRSGAAARAKAYRDRKRERDARDGDDAEPVTGVTTGRDAERDEKRDASRSEPLPTPLPFRSGSSGEEKENPKTTTTLSARARVTTVTVKRDASRVTSERRLHNLAEALEVRIGDRARYVLEHAHEAEWLEPQRWPELTRLAAAYEASTGQKARLGRYQADAGVRAMVSHYAADYTEDELEHVYGAVASQRWFNEPGKRHGLSSVTLEVVRRTLAGRREDQAEQAKVDELIELATRARPPARAATSVGSLLSAALPPEPEEAADAR